MANDTPINKLMHALQTKRDATNNEVLQEVTHALSEGHAGLHGHLSELALAVKILIGVQQRMLSKFEEAFGVPKGDMLVFSQASPSANTVYTSGSLGYDGVIRGLVLSGNGNVKLVQNDSLSIGGAYTLAVVACNGGAINVPVRHKFPIGSTLSVQTDSSAGTGIVGVTAWIEPCAETGAELFQMRR